MATVKVSFTESGDEVSISVQPEQLDLSGEAGNVEINWDLDSNIDQARFDIAGVTIHQPHGAKFSDRGQPNPKRHKWQRIGGPDGQTYKYAISLFGLPGKRPLHIKIDPTIRN